MLKFNSSLADFTLFVDCSSSNCQVLSGLFLLDSGRTNGITKDIHFIVRSVLAALQTFKCSLVCDDAVYDIRGIIASVSIVR